MIFGKFIHLVFQKLLEKLFDIFIAAAFRIFLILTNLQMLSFKEIQLLPEIFLGISIIYLLIHGTFMSVSPKYLLILNDLHNNQDEKVILATLTIKKLSPSIRVVAQINDKNKIPFLRRANVDAVLSSDDYNLYMSLSHVLDPGRKGNAYNREICDPFPKISDWDGY